MNSHQHIPDFNAYSCLTGPCGDTMQAWLSVRRNIITRISFASDGCGSSRECARMAGKLAQGKSLDEASRIEQSDILSALGGVPPEFEHCALLASNTLKKACQTYQENMLNADLNQKKQHVSCSSCKDSQCTASTKQKDESDKEFAERIKLQSRMKQIGKKIVILSGKGGVGKSTVAVNLACALMLSGKKVGLLDADIHGPSIPTMLDLSREQIITSPEGLHPVQIGDLYIMSLGFLLQNPDDAVIWRGPMKMGVIQQFLKDVLWGDLDYLIVDLPPGTGDEPLSICQLIGSLDGAIVVTTPQKVAAIDVRKSVTFCKRMKVPVMGIIENMSGFVCPKCGEITHIFSENGGRRIAEDMNVPFLGSIPIDPEIVDSGDSGKVFLQHYASTGTAQIMDRIMKNITQTDPEEELSGTQH